MTASRFKVMSIIGTRPQFIKAAPVSNAISAHPRLEECLVNTGQHSDYRTSDLVVQELSAPKPGYHLGIHGGSHGEMTGRMLMQLDALARKESPDLVLVYGDTNSTLAGALTAAKLNIPLAHVEAGLRSRNRRMPEETNRIATDHLSTLMFCPTRAASENLAAEGIPAGVHVVGDVMFDLSVATKHLMMEKSSILTELRLMPDGYAICTIHRGENTDDPKRLREIIAFVATEAGDTPAVMPVHPRTKQRFSEFGIGSDELGALRLIEPVDYLDMQRLLSGARIVFTDSGGLQKEAYFHRVPCVTLRDETEWTETVEAGWNRLWTSDGYASRREIEDYGNGHAAESIARILFEYLHENQTV